MKLNSKKLISIWFMLILVIGVLSVPPAHASRTEIIARATVRSFGTYSFEGVLVGDIRKPGICELGTITVKGTYNGPYPWIMRIYTDNVNYIGIGGGFGIEGSAGLISKDSKYKLPLEANCLNWGEEEWLRIPDLNDPGYKQYAPAKDVGTGTYSERIIIAIDPRNADWVSGRDRVMFTADDNPLGDITLETPFEIKFRTKIGPNTPNGNYGSRVYIEIISAP